MVSFLVCYGTGEGQTAKIANRIADALESRGHDATTIDATDATDSFPLEGYDAVVVGASVHLGAHQPAVGQFVSEHLDDLTSRPTAFFQVSISSAVPDESRQADAARYVDEFLAETDWHPDRIGLFGGALRYSKYGFLKRLVMKRIAKGATGDTATARDYEYTDWDEVEAFAADVAAFVEGRLGLTPPESSERAPVDETNGPE